MTYYRLHHIKGGRFAWADEVRADDDAEACRLAEPLVGILAAELWCGLRKVKIYNADGEWDA